MNLAIVGLGGVGRTLCRQAADIGVGIVSVIDSSGALVSLNGGFSKTEVDELISAKASGAKLADLAGPTSKNMNPTEALDFIASNSESPIVADCSAMEDANQYVSSITYTI